jgi:uncharacterized membrane protein YoaK (UPF0700 family)
MTVVTGMVDAFSYLTLGHVFVANMTGNVVFLAFGLLGVTGFSIATAVVALAAFTIGALAGGRIGSKLAGRPWSIVGAGTAVEALFLGSATAISVLLGPTLAEPQRYVVTGVLGVAMGLQNATARTLAVPDLTTTVLTLTITGIAADSHLVGGPGSRAGRRLLSIAAMLAGAIVGATLILRGHAPYVLAIAFAIVLGIAVAVRLPWTKRPSSKSPV